MNGNFSGSLLTQVIEIVHIIKTKKKKKGNERILFVQTDI